MKLESDSDRDPRDVLVAGGCTPRAAELWMDQPNATLDGRKPRDAMGTDHDRVIRSAESFTSGMP